LIGDLAVGYVTIDNVRGCSVLFPSDPGYFGPNGVAIDQNQLWGDFEIVRGNNAMVADALVHIEADPSFSPTSGYTFYGRYVMASGLDHREPLGTVWAGTAEQTQNGLTEYLVWRDSTSRLAPVAGYACNQQPEWYPLTQAELWCFNEVEDNVLTCLGDECFPLETQRVTNGQAFWSPFDYGWCRFNLNTVGDAFTGDVDFIGGVQNQSYVIVTRSAAGNAGSAHQAMQVDQACGPTP
jgi:hypothetical protein